MSNSVWTEPLGSAACQQTAAAPRGTSCCVMHRLASARRSSAGCRPARACAGDRHRTRPRPDRSRRSRGDHRAALSCRPGFLICRRPRRSSRRALFCTGFPGRRENSSTRPPHMRTAVHSPHPRRGCGSSPSGARRRGATSCCSRSRMRPASEELDRLKAATAALADPRKTDPAAAEQLVASGAADLLLQRRRCTRTRRGSTESVLELAYRLAVSEQPMIRRIRENLIVLINPVVQPRRPRQTGRVVLSVPQGQDGAGRNCRARRRPTGPSMRSSTSTATRTSRCTRPPRPFTA